MSLAPLVTLVASLLGCGASAPPIWTRPGLEGHVRPEMGPPQPGDAAPPFELPAADGRPFRLASARGGWVVLHFTAIWCPFCDVEIEHLDALAGDYAARGVRVVVMDVLDDAGPWQAYLANLGVRHLLALRDADGSVARRYAPPRANPSIPERAPVVLASTLVVDPAGVIRLYLLSDSAHFDPSLAAVRRELDRFLGRRSPSGAPAVPPSEVPAAPGADALLAPERVVELEVAELPPVPVGTGFEVRLTLQIADGYHVMSDHPSRPSYIATALQWDAPSSVACEAPRFGEAVPFVLTPEETLSTFAGSTAVTTRCRVDPVAAPGPRRLAGRLTYQACTTGSCLFPVTRAVVVPLEVAPPAPGAATVVSPP